MPTKNNVKDTTKKSTTKKSSTKKTVTQKVIDKNKVKINPVSEEKQNKSKAELLKQAEALSNIRKGLSKTQKVTIASLAGVAVATSVVVPLVCYVVNKNDTTIAKPLNIAVYTNYTDAEDGQEVFNIKPGTKVSELKPIVKDGYIFKGYYMDEECKIPYDSNHVLKESDKIYALLEAIPVEEFTTNTYFFVTGEKPIPLTINTGMTIEEVEQAYWEMLKEVFEITDLTWQQLKEMLIQEIQQQEGLKFIGLCKDELGTQYPASYKMKTTDTEIHLVFVEATYNLLVPFSDGYVITDTAGEPITSFGTVPHGETIKFKIRLKEGYFGANEVKVGDTILTATNEVYSYSVTSEAEISVSDAYLIAGQYNLNLGSNTEVMYLAENQTLESSLRANGYSEENTIGFYSEAELENYIDISNTIATEDVTIYTIYGWKISDGVLTNVDSSVNSNITEFIITSNVTSIGEEAFKFCISLTSITIPNSVTSIGGGAFEHCRSLASITISENLISIGSYAFNACSKLTSITIPSSVTSIGTGAFNACTVLEYNTSNGLKYLGNESNPYHVLITVESKNINTVNIEEGCRIIGDGAFPQYNKLISITIPSSVISIGNGAFANCDALTSITIPSGVTSIGDLAFYNSRKLTSVVFEEGSQLTSIGDYVFSYCSLTSITIPEGVMSIGSRAFLFCGNLTNITIPSSVTSIGEEAFSYCSSLTNVTFEDPYGWILIFSSNSNKIITDIILTDTSQNATYLKSTYNSYYWYKK